MFLRNVGSLSTDYTTLYPRRYYSARFFVDFLQGEYSEYIGIICGSFPPIYYNSQHLIVPINTMLLNYLRTEEREEVQIYDPSSHYR
jgi:hypothetical protein